MPEICDWITEKGGPDGLTAGDVFIILDCYLYGTSPSGYSFTTTIEYLFGVLDYYLGFNGDSLTGCDFFVPPDIYVTDVTLRK